MIRIIQLAAFLFLLATGSQAQPATGNEKAKKLENQVRQYFFVMLLKGPHRDQDSLTLASIQQGHLANINRLYQAGKLKVAGPFGDEGNWLGIFIFDCSSKEEVERLLRTDPAIMAGRIVYEIHPWWTSPVGSFIPGVPATP